MTDNTDDDTLHRLATGPLGCHRTEPRFDAGKSYRTRGGEVATVDTITPNEVYPVRGAIGKDRHVWLSTGGWNRYAPENEYSFDLLPGAIEDEPKPGDDARTQCLEIGFEATNQRVGNLMNTMEVLERHEVIVALAQRLAAVEADRNALNSLVGGMQTRITALESRPSLSELAIFDSTMKHITTLLGWARERGFEPGDVGKTASELTVEDFRQFGEGKSKRTIKGGWVNVYLEAGKMWLGVVYPSKGFCDDFKGGRIACIQIPDITEGEGL